MWEDYVTNSLVKMKRYCRILYKYHVCEHIKWEIKYFWQGETWLIRENVIQWHGTIHCTILPNCAMLNYESVTRHINIERDWSKWILVVTCLFHLDPHQCFFQFSFKEQFTMFGSFLGHELLELFWCPKWRFILENGMTITLQHGFRVKSFIPSI